MSRQCSVPNLPLSSGHSIPQVGLGTWMCKPPGVKEIVKNAVRNGYRHIDCAFVYANQPEIGQALRELFQEGVVKREDLFITSKIWNTFHSYDTARLHVDSILGQLGIVYLDLCLIHWPMGYQEGGELFPKNEAGDKVFLSEVDYLETWKALEKTVEDGKVRSIGLSNFNSAQAQRVIDNCTIKPCAIQTECHPYFQQPKLREFCKNNGIVLTASCPLASSPDNMFRKEKYPSVFNDETIAKIANTHGKSNAQVALRFLTQLGLAVIPRSSNAERQRQNLDIFDFSLSESEMAAMEQLETGKRIVYLHVSAHSPHFPWGDGCPDDQGY